MEMLLAAGCLIYMLLTIVLIFVPRVPRQYRAASGEIVRFRGDLPGNPPRAWVYYPVVRFLDESGTLHEWEALGSATQPQYATGTMVRIYYDPAGRDGKPPGVIIDSEQGLPIGFRIFQMVAFVGFVPLVALAYAHLNGKGIASFLRKGVFTGGT